MNPGYIEILRLPFRATMYLMQDVLMMDGIACEIHKAEGDYALYLYEGNARAASAVLRANLVESLHRFINPQEPPR